MTNWRTEFQDIVEDSFLRRLVFTRHRWVLVGVALAVALPVAIGGGWLIAEVGVLPVMALLAGALVFAALVRDIELAFASVIGVVTLLPFATVPYSIGFRPTFLDLALGALFFVWLLPYALGEEQHLIVTPVGGLVLAFALIAVGTFVAGLGHGPLTAYLLRHFAEILLSIGLFFLTVNIIHDVGRLGRLIRWLILGTAGAATVGIGLYFLPGDLAIQALSALGRIGYPTGPGVLRYIRDDPTLMRRATATSVDPNILGSLLNLVMVITVPQLFARRPLVPRWLLVPLLGLMGIALGLTVSRGSMAGMVIGVVFISVLRYRRLLPWIALVAALFLVLPWSRGYIQHFVEGVMVEDLSTQMRMGEYRDTLQVIHRYPVLGVGFAGAPDLDLYVAVANVYLLIAAQTGLVGLTVFLTILGTLLWRFWTRRQTARALPTLEPLWYGLHGAIIGGLIGGGFDHYFFSLDFHNSVTLFWMVVGLATAATELIDRHVSAAG